MSTLTFCTAQGFWAATTSDSADVGSDPDLVPIRGDVTFTYMVREGDVFRALTLDTPTGVALGPVKGVLRDGVLKDLRGNTGVRLLANTSVLNLSGDLYCAVKFSNTTARGQAVSIKGFPFALPDTDTVVNLVEVTPVTGTLPSGITQGAPGDPTYPTVVDDGPPVLVQWKTAEGTNVGPPVEMPGLTPLPDSGGGIDLRHWPDIAKAQWKSNLGAVYASGQSTMTNSITPFTSADVGKIVIVNPTHPTEVYNRWIATITAVNGSGVATLDSPAPSTANGERIYWGFDVTDALNEALQEIRGDHYTPKEAYLPGIYRLTQLVIPVGVTLRGAGWSVGAEGYQSGQQGTTLKQLPGAEKDFVVFETTNYNGQNWVGPCGLTDVLLEGPEHNVAGHTPTIGSGVALRNSAGDPAIALDGCNFSWIQSNYFPEHGFDLPGGGVPLVMDNWRALQNGGYGIDYNSATAAATQMVHLLNYTCDGNTLVAVRFRNVSEYGPIAITALKSEATPDSFRLVEPLGDSYQMESVIFEDCDDTPVVINGISHIYAGGTQGPGPAIVIRSATDKRPRIVFNAVAVRVTGGETGSTADAVTLRDEVETVDVPRTTVSGVYPGSLAATYVEQPNTGNQLVVGNGSGYVEVSVENGDTNADMYLTPAGTGVVRAQNGYRVMTLSGSESPINKTFDNTSIFTIRDDRLTLQDNADTTKQAKFELSGITAATTRTFTLPDASTTLVGTDTTQTLTGKTLTTPKIAQVLDANGNVIIDTASVASAVNHVQLRNTATGGRAEIAAHGGDTNIDIDLLPKGTGVVRANGLTVATLTGTQNVLNKTLDNSNTVTLRDDRFTLQDNGDTTKQAVFQLSGITTATTRTYTLPDASTTLVGTDATQTLTGKTLTNPVVSDGIYDATGVRLLRFVPDTTPVNYLQIENGSTGNGATLRCRGSDTNPDFWIGLQGTGQMKKASNGAVFATRSDTETFTNKTLTSPKVTSGNAPATASSTGTAGQVEWDTGFVYVCTASNTWKRAALSTW